MDLHLGFLDNFEFVVASRLRKLEKLIVIVQIHLAFVDCSVFICRILIILIQNKRPINGFILWNNLAYNRRLNLQDSFLWLVDWVWIYANLALKRISVIQKVNNLLGLGKLWWDRNPIKLLQGGFRDGLLNGFDQFGSLGQIVFEVDGFDLWGCGKLLVGKGLAIHIIRTGYLRLLVELLSLHSAFRGWLIVVDVDIFSFF